jgi:ABC-2 type transport system ATP-binding protein
VTPPLASPAAEVRLEARGLSKTYGAVRALEDLSFTARAGEIVGLLGPNGAGKTTAIHILLGMLRPTSGEAALFGLSPLERPYDIYPRINFSSAYVQLPYNMKVDANLRFFARLYAVPDAEVRIAELLGRFGIAHLARSATGALSSGEQTRLNLCKSLLNDPEILFLDEPTASLDPDIAERVRETLKSIQRSRRITVLYTSHNMSEVEALCDRVIFLHRGRKIIEGTSAEVRDHFNKESLEKVFIHLARGGDLKVLDGEEA